MTLGQVVEVCSFPLWVQSEEEIYTDRYEEFDVLAMEQWMNWSDEVKSITVDGAGELVIEI